MMILIVLFGLLFAVGLFFILAEVLKLPRLATGKAMLSAVNQHKGKAKNLDVLIGSLSVKIAKYLPMCICQSKIPPNYNRKFLQRSKKIIALVTSV